MSVYINGSSYQLVELEIVKDNVEYIIENKSTGDFYEMNEVSVKAIQYLQEDCDIDTIEADLKTSYPDEEIDMKEFLNQLLELGVLIDPQKKIDKKIDSTNILNINNIPINFGKLFFNQISIIIYPLLFIANITYMLFNSKLRPHYEDFFIFDSITFNLLTWLVVSLLIIMIHESGHVLAARSFGLPTGLGIGSRLLFVVFETDLTYIWRLPRTKRNVVYLAGLSFDTVLFFVSILGQLIFEDSSFLYVLCKLVAIQITINIVYQFGIFMKTDLYYFLENTIGCYNLQEMTKDYFVKLFKGKKHEEERGTVFFLYGFIYLFGTLMILTAISIYALPQMYHALKISFQYLDHSPKSLAFWDGAVFIAETALMLGLLFYSWIKKYKTYKSGDSFE